MKEQILNTGCSDLAYLTIKPILMEISKILSHQVQEEIIPTEPVGARLPQKVSHRYDQRKVENSYNGAESQELSSFGFIDEEHLSFLPHTGIYSKNSEPAGNDCPVHSFICNIAIKGIEISFHNAILKGKCRANGHGAQHKGQAQKNFKSSFENKQIQWITSLQHV